jgi:hypothetical protein
MVEFSEFNITNTTGSLVIISSLDNFNLPSGSVRNVFSSESGSFSMADIVNNSEIEALLQSGSISITDENGGVVQTTVPLFGHVYTTITPDPFTVTQNNYNPPGWYNSKIVNLEPSGADRFIGGFQKTYNGDRKTVKNLSTSFQIGILNNNGSNLEQNRIFNPQNNTTTIRVASSIVFYYDGGLQRWIYLNDEKS